MALEPTTRRSRRALLSTAAAAVIGALAAAVGRPLPAAAADGDPMLVGRTNPAQDRTRLEGPLSVETDDISMLPALVAQDLSVDGYTAIRAMSTEGLAVSAETENGDAAIAAWASNPFSVALSGTNTGGGLGLSVHGKVALRTRSGRATIPAGRSFVDVDLRGTIKGGLGGTPLCFANLTSHRPGVHVEAVRPNDPIAGKARIYLNRPVSSTTYVAWFVLN